MALGMLSQEDAFAPLRTSAVTDFWKAKHAGIGGMPATAPSYAKSVLGSTLGYDPTKKLAEDAAAWQSRKQAAMQTAFQRQVAATAPGGMPPSPADFARDYRYTGE